MNYSLKNGEKLKTLRKMRGLSQKKLAELSQCSQKTLSNLENNKTKADFKQIMNICSVLKISTDEILSTDPVEIEKLTKPKNRRDKHPAFVGRIKIEPYFSSKKIELLKNISQRLGPMPSEHLKILQNLIDICESIKLLKLKALKKEDQID